MPTYGVLSAIALILTLFFAMHYGRRAGLDPDRTWNLGIITILSAMAGAKLLLILNDWSYYSAHPRELYSVSTLQAGGVYSGGVVLGFAGALLYIWRHHMPVFKTLDVCAPGIALGHAVGRLGCFAAGCCYGKPTHLPWGVTFTNPLAAQVVGTPLGVPLHPTQLYEFLVELLNFGILVWLFPRKKFDGQIMGTYLFVYGLARYFLEFLRDDPERGSVFNGVMTTTQLISILMVVAGGAMWLRLPRAGKTLVAGTAS